MKKESLILDIRRDETMINEFEANISISLEVSNESSDNLFIKNYKNFTISVKEVNQLSNDIVDSIHSTQNGSCIEDQYKSMEQKGKMLCDELLPATIKKELHKSSAQYLIINVDDHLVNIPFELLFLNDQFLCQKFAIGRDVRTQQTIHSRLQERKPPYNMAIVCNPTGDLSHATKEGRSIRTVLKNNSFDSMEMRTNVSKNWMKSQLSSFDIVHFAGHASFDPEYPEESGLKLSDGRFTAKDIGKLVYNKQLPHLIFSNACQSARTNAWDTQPFNNSAIYGIANAFKLAGVKHYLGTFWNIADTTSHNFACLFYQYFLAGETVGMSMLKARKELMSDQQDLCWASYHLYGDPRTRYFPIKETLEPPITLETNANKPESSTTSFKEQNKSNRSEEIDKTNCNSQNPNMGNPSESIQQTDDISTGHQDTELTGTNDISTGHQDTELTGTKIEEPQQKNNYKKYVKQYVILTIILFVILLSAKIIINFISPADDNWTSTVKKIAVVFDPKDNELTDVIQKKICHAFEKKLSDIPRFKLLERMKIKIITTEIDLWMSKYSENSGNIPKILHCDIIVFVDFIASPEDSEVCVKLLQPYNSELPEIIISKLKSEQIFGPYDHLADQLVQNLYDSNPIQGKISTVSKMIHLNIGEDVGVEVGQNYEVIENDSILKIHATEKNQSFANIIVNKGNLYSGYRVKLNKIN